MKQVQILAALRTIIANNQEYTTWTISTPHLVALVNKFVQDEREACAYIAENWNSNGSPRVGVAKKIRARKTT